MTGLKTTRVSALAAAFVLAMGGPAVAQTTYGMQGEWLIMGHKNVCGLMKDGGDNGFLMLSTIIDTDNQMVSISSTAFTGLPDDPLTLEISGTAVSLTKSEIEPADDIAPVTLRLFFTMPIGSIANGKLRVVQRGKTIYRGAFDPPAAAINDWQDCMDGF